MSDWTPGIGERGEAESLPSCGAISRLSHRCPSSTRTASPVYEYMSRRATARRRHPAPCYRPPRASSFRRRLDFSARWASSPAWARSASTACCRDHPHPTTTPCPSDDTCLDGRPADQAPDLMSFDDRTDCGVILERRLHGERSLIDITQGSRPPAPLAKRSEPALEAPRSEASPRSPAQRRSTSKASVQSEASPWGPAQRRSASKASVRSEASMGGVRSEASMGGAGWEPPAGERGEAEREECGSPPTRTGPTCEQVEPVGL